MRDVEDVKIRLVTFEVGKMLKTAHEEMIEKLLMRLRLR